MADYPETQVIPGAAVDLDRQRRCGFAEVVYAEGKPADLVVRIFQQLRDAGQPALATRVNATQAAAVLKAFPNCQHNTVANTLRISDELCEAETSDSETINSQAQVAIVTAGSCDASVAQEALETLKWMSVAAVLIEDVGVAGPSRLVQHVPLLQQMKVIVCVAGMEAALPSVLGGYVSCPIIGVPTSVGYGASLEGITALLSMLTCCSSNVVTVNIDAGFRGGYVAGMIASQNTRKQ